MNGRRREQVTGLYPGPYTVGAATKSDIPVTADGPEGPVVVGRFPITKSMDYAAQAKAYGALPDMISILMEMASLGTTGGLAERARNALMKAGIDA